MEILKVEHLVKTYGEGDNQFNAVDENIALPCNLDGTSCPVASSREHLLPEP